MFIRDSRRSYKTYSYVELILITDLGAFRTPVGVTELSLTELILVLRNLYWSYGTYICIQDLLLSYGSYTGLSELILVLQNLY